MRSLQKIAGFLGGIRRIALTLNFCAGFFWRKAVSMCDALYFTIHGHASVNTTFCMGTAAIVRHTALLST